MRGRQETPGPVKDIKKTELKSLSLPNVSSKNFNLARLRRRNRFGSRPPAQDPATETTSTEGISVPHLNVLILLLSDDQTSLLFLLSGLKSDVMIDIIWYILST